VHDVSELLDGVRGQGRAENTIAGAPATLQCVMRFVVRNGWIADSPVNKLDADERPHPSRLTYRVLGREEIQRLLDACLPAYRTLIATAREPCEAAGQSAVRRGARHYRTRREARPAISREEPRGFA
jgi:site-specific recombinase XerD